MVACALRVTCHVGSLQAVSGHMKLNEYVFDFFCVRLSQVRDLLDKSLAVFPFEVCLTRHPENSNA